MKRRSVVAHLQIVMIFLHMAVPGIHTAQFRDSEGIYIISVLCDLAVLFLPMPTNPLDRRDSTIVET